MVDFEKITPLAFMTCIVNLDAYDLHPRDEKVLNNPLMNVEIMHYTHDRCLFLSKIIMVYLYN
jgi:hypothetical protein